MQTVLWIALALLASALLTRQSLVWYRHRQLCRAVKQYQVMSQPLEGPSGAHLSRVVPMHTTHHTVRNVCLPRDIIRRAG